MDTITDPAFHVDRNMEDHLSWVRGSKILKQIKEFQGNQDDYETMEWLYILLIKISFRLEKWESFERSI